MPQLDNPRHEKFCQLVADGRAGSAAYQQVFGCARESAEASASRLRDDGDIEARIAELQKQQSDKSEMSRDQLRLYLIEVLKTPAGEVLKTHRLCQGFKDTAEVQEIKMPDKLAAAAQLAKLCGWNEPDKMDHGGDGLAQLLRLVRDGE